MTKYNKLMLKTGMPLVFIGTLPLIVSCKNNSNSSDIISSNGFEFNKSTGEIKQYIGNEKEIVIPDEIESIKIKSIAKGAFKNKEISTLKVSKNVETINSEAFMNCKLNSVVFDNNSNLSKIDKSAFENNNITTLTIPSSVVFIEPRAFYQNKIQTLNFDKNNSKLLVIGNQTFQNNQITELNLPDSLKTIGRGAFSDNKITTLNFGRNVTMIGEGAFSLNKITKVNSTNEGEFRFLYIADKNDASGQQLKVIVEKNAFMGNDGIKKVLSNERVSLDPNSFDSGVTIEKKQASDYNENGILK